MAEVRRTIDDMIRTKRIDTRRQYGEGPHVAPFGDAPTLPGAVCGVRLNSPVIDAAVTPTGLGYWLVASDGGVFSIGDAPFHGSMGGQRLNQPVIGLAPAQDGAAHPLSHPTRAPPQPVGAACA